MLQSSVDVAPRLWHLRKLYYDSLVRQIQLQTPDVVHFRHGPHFLQLLRLRQQFPDDASLFFDSTDPHDLPRALRHAVELSATEKILKGENARRYVQQFTWASVAEKTKALYDSCAHS